MEKQGSVGMSSEEIVCQILTKRKNKYLNSPHMFKVNTYATKCIAALMYRIECIRRGMHKHDNDKNIGFVGDFIMSMDEWDDCFDFSLDGMYGELSMTKDLMDRPLTFDVLQVWQNTLELSELVECDIVDTVVDQMRDFDDCDLFRHIVLSNAYLCGKIIHGGHFGDTVLDNKHLIKEYSRVKIDRYNKILTHCDGTKIFMSGDTVDDSELLDVYGENVGDGVRYISGDIAFCPLNMEDRNDFLEEAIGGTRDLVAANQYVCLWVMKQIEELCRLYLDRDINKEKGCTIRLPDLCVVSNRGDRETNRVIKVDKKTGRRLELVTETKAIQQAYKETLSSGLTEESPVEIHINKTTGVIQTNLFRKGVGIMFEKYDGIYYMKEQKANYADVRDNIISKYGSIDENCATFDAFSLQGIMAEMAVIL